MRGLKPRQKIFPVINQHISGQIYRFASRQGSIVEIYRRSKCAPATIPITLISADKNVLDRFYNCLRVHLVYFSDPTIPQWYEARSKIQNGRIKLVIYSLGTDGRDSGNS